MIQLTNTIESFLEVLKFENNFNGNSTPDFSH